MPIKDETTRIQTAKANIKSMIEAKGENITIPSDATLDDYPTYLGSLYTEYDNKIATATASETAVLNRISALETSFKQALIAKGETITGTETLKDFAAIISDIPTGVAPIETDWNDGYTTGSDWIYQVNNPPTNCSDIYEIQSGVKYYLFLGSTVGNRFRGITTQTDIRTISSGKITGDKVAGYADDKVVPYLKVSFTAAYDGYLVITKDNGKNANNEYEYHPGIPTYLLPVI